MKNTATLTAVMLALVAAFALSAIAEEPASGANFVDEDGDGVCDLYQAGSGGRGNGGGKGGGCRTGEGKGVNFVDEDDNGICDYFEDGGAGAGLGYGKGRCGDASFDEDSGDGASKRSRIASRESRSGRRGGRRGMGR